MPADTRTVGVTLGVDLAVALGCLCVFSLLRVARGTRRWYAPSRFRTAADAAAAAVGAYPGHPLPGAPQPPALPLTLLTWVVPLMRLREAEVIRCSGGLDVAMYLRVIRFGALRPAAAAAAAAARCWMVAVLLLLTSVWCLGCACRGLSRACGTRLTQHLCHLPKHLEKPPLSKKA